jgi:uracil-DNA glycosylase family 4
MIIGEAPGRDEVREGRPFVGECGELLEEALGSFGLARGEVYITNLVKELPLDLDNGIRRPNNEEIAEWQTVLQREMSDTAAEAILALGRTASDALTGDKGLPFGSRVENVYTAWYPRHVKWRETAERLRHENSSSRNATPRIAQASAGGSGSGARSFQTSCSTSRPRSSWARIERHREPAGHLLTSPGWHATLAVPPPIGGPHAPLGR